jgi:Phosphatidylglycerophosphate synthase
VDGAVARATSRVSAAGAFTDSSMDRFAEVAVYAGLAAGARAPGWMIALALGLSLTVSYMRARLESLSRERPRGLELGERAERLLALGVLSALGLPLVGVALVLALAIETNVERFYLYVGHLRAARRGSARHPLLIEDLHADPALEQVPEALRVLPVPDYRAPVHGDGDLGRDFGGRLRGLLRSHHVGPADRQERHRDLPPEVPHLGYMIWCPPRDTR